MFSISLASYEVKEKAEAGGCVKFSANYTRFQTGVSTYTIFFYLNHRKHRSPLLT